MSKTISLLLKFIFSAMMFFAVTFTVYFFNLDMKLLSKYVEPILLKHYDKLPRDQHV